MVANLICLWAFALVVIAVGVFITVGGIVGLISKELIGVFFVILGLFMVALGGNAGWSDTNTIIYAHQHEAVCTGRDCTDDIHKVGRRGCSSSRRMIYPILIPMAQPHR